MMYKKFRHKFSNIGKLINFRENILSAPPTYFLHVNSRQIFCIADNTDDNNFSRFLSQMRNFYRWFPVALAICEANKIIFIANSLKNSHAKLFVDIFSGSPVTKLTGTPLRASENFDRYGYPRIWALDEKLFTGCINSSQYTIKMMFHNPGNFCNYRIFELLLLKKILSSN
jgi:hypothetical protein